MLIHVISDTAARLASVRTALERKHAVTSELLGGLSIQRTNIQALVVRVDLQSIQTICTLKKILASLSRVQKRMQENHGVPLNYDDAVVDLIASRCTELESGGRRDVTRQDGVAKAWGKALDLAFDAVGHVNGAAIRDVTVGPARVVACRSATSVDVTLLGHQDERRVGDPACAGIRL